MGCSPSRHKVAWRQQLQTAYQPQLTTMERVAESLTLIAMRLSPHCNPLKMVELGDGEFLTLPPRQSMQLRSPRQSSPKCRRQTPTRMQQCLALAPTALFA